MWNRIQRNVPQLLAFAGAYVAGVLLTDLAIQSIRLGTVDLRTSLATAAVSALVFCVASGAVLFVHQPVRRAWPAAAAVALGIAVVSLTWGLWLQTDPSFRHAVPIELLALFVLPMIFGLAFGVTLYFRALRQTAV